MPTELRDMLLEEASGLLQPTVFLRFLVDFSKNHPPEELFQFKQKGQPGAIAEKLRVLCPFCFQIETSSSPNWTFALGIECWQQSRTLSISAAHLTTALSTTFPRATLGFEPTPFGIHLAIQAALTFLHYGPSPNVGFALLPQPQAPIGASPLKRSRHLTSITPTATSSTSQFNPLDINPPIGGLLTVNPLSQPQHPTNVSVGLHAKITRLLQADPLLQETLSTFSRDRVQFLFDLACISGSPIETMWETIQKFD